MSATKSTPDSGPLRKPGGGGWQEKFIRFFIYNFVVDNAEET